MANYIKEIRELVGHKPIILNASGGLVLSLIHISEPTRP